jgi:hypothetical protein
MGLAARATRMGQPSREERGRGSKFSLRTVRTWQLGLVTLFQDGRVQSAQTPPRKPWRQSRELCILSQAQNQNSR